MPRGVLDSVVSMALVLAMISGAGPAFAQSPGPDDPPPRKTSGARRLIGTLIGGGIGLGAGMLFGTVVFEDSIDSDRKAWTATVTGAALGALIGNLSTRQVKPATMTGQQPARRASWPPPSGGRVTRNREHPGPPSRNKSRRPRTSPRSRGRSGGGRFRTRGSAAATCSIRAFTIQDRKSCSGGRSRQAAAKATANRCWISSRRTRQRLDSSPRSLRAGS